MSNFPSFVNTGALATATASSITPSLPGSRVSGNMLLAWCKSTAAGSKTISLDSTSSSWTLFTSINQGSAHPMALAYRAVDGAEAAPKFDLTSSGTCEAQVRQYAPSAATGGPWVISIPGGLSSNSQGSTSSITCPSITTKGDDSLVLWMTAADGAPTGTLAFVNSGTFTLVTASSVTPPLPTTRTNNNILLAFCRTGVLTTSLTCSTSGWNKVFNALDSNNSCYAALYWAKVTGSETAPVFTMSTTDLIEGWVVQYTGADFDNPIGAVSSAGGKAVTVVTVPGLTTTADNSVVVWCTMCVTSGQTSPIPIGYTARATDSGAEAWADKSFPTHGTATGNVSVTYTTAVGNWDGFLVELLQATKIGVPSGFTAEDTATYTYAIGDKQNTTHGTVVGPTSVTQDCDDATTFTIELANASPVPKLVNSGAVDCSGSALNIQPALPASRVNGNLLLAYCEDFSANANIITVSSGWTIAASLNNSGANYAKVVAYAFVTGSEVAPIFSIPPSDNGDIMVGQVLQYSGTDGTSPIGAVSSHDSQTGGSTITCPKVTTTGINSLVVSLLGCTGTVTIPKPSGFTQDTSFSSGSVFIPEIQINMSHESAGVLGTDVGPISVTATNTNNSAFLIELLSPAFA